MMKHYLALALAAFALILVAPSASAIRIRVVDAPPVDCTALSAIDPNATCSITDPNDTYAMSFVPASGAGCQSAEAIPDPGADITGFNWCILLTNLSGAPLTTFNFTFAVPNQGANDDYNNVFCDGFPDSVSNSFCPSGPLHVGDMITASFSADPGVPHRETPYLFVDFENNPGTATVTLVSVPEPGELGLFGLGLLAIGVGYGWEKRRQSRLSHTAR